MLTAWANTYEKVEEKGELTPIYEYFGFPSPQQLRRWALFMYKHGHIKEGIHFRWEGTGPARMWILNVEECKKIQEAIPVKPEGKKNLIKPQIKVNSKNKWKHYDDNDYVNYYED